MAVDPLSGTILRLTIEADMKADDPISVAEIMVEYGSVEIGGNKFVCPVKSLSVSAALVPEISTHSPIKKSLNVTEFTDYHQFRTTSHLLAEGTPEATESQETQSPTTPITSSDSPATAVSSASALAPTEPEPGHADASIAKTDSTPTTQPAASEPSPPPPMPVNASTEVEQESLLREMPVYKTYAREVVVDVVVTKGNDDPVLGLHKQDFALMEDGKPQTIDFFEEHTANTPPPGAQQPLPHLPPNTYTNIPPAPESDAVNVLLLDSLNTSKQDQSWVHLEIMDFIQKMQPGTRVAIFTLGSKLQFVQGFTTDTSVLLAALKDKRNSMEPQKGAASRDRSDTAADAAEIARLQMMLAPASAIEALKAAQAANANFAQGARASMTFEALNYIARYLASVPGRKNLIWFSGSFPVVIFPTAAQREEMEHAEAHGLLDRAKKTANLFTASKVAVYPVSAEGMMDEHISDANNAGPAATEGGGHIGGEMNTMAPYNEGAGERAGTIAAMEQLAADTGGKAFFNTNDLNAATQKAVANGAHYYTLVYTPTNNKMDGSFRRIEVKTPGAKYQLAYRRGYNADDVPRLAETKVGTNPLQALMTPGMPDATQILFAARVLPQVPQPAANSARAGKNGKLTGKTTRYTIDFMIRWTDVKLDAQADGSHAGKIQVELLAFDRDGHALNWTGETQRMKLSPDLFKAIEKSGVPAHAEIDLPTDKDVLLEAGVYDWETEKAGTIAVPLPAHSAAVAAVK
jgi:VWFA-related protein